MNDLSKVDPPRIENCPTLSLVGLSSHYKDEASAEGIPKQWQQFMARMDTISTRKNEEVTYGVCMNYEEKTGAMDYVLRIVTRDIHAFDDFQREKLLALGLVSNIETRIVIRSVKASTAVPLGLVAG